MSEHVGYWGAKRRCSCDDYRPDTLVGDSVRSFLDHHVPARGFLVICEHAISVA